MRGRPPRDDRRDAILACIETSWRDTGRGPSYRDLAVAGGLTVPGAAYHLRILIDAGCVAVQRGKPGTLRVVDELC